jgi:TonB family protein
MIESKCPSCGDTKFVPDDKVGKKYSCPKCNNVVEVVAPQAIEVISTQETVSKPEITIQKQPPPSVVATAPSEIKSNSSRNFLITVVLLVGLAVAGWFFYEKCTGANAAKADVSADSTEEINEKVVEINPFNEEHTFQLKAPFKGNARSRAISFTLGNYGFYGTGNWANGESEQSDMWKYDFAQDEWVDIASFPKGMQAGVGFNIGSYGYAGVGWGGGNAFTDFFEYRPETNSWMRMASYPGTPTNDAVGFSINNYGYVGMGAQPYGNVLSDFYQFDQVNNTWKVIQGFPGAPRRNAFGLGIGEAGFIGGGSDGKKPLVDCYRFNQYDGLWEKMNEYPNKASFDMGKVAFEINGTIFLCGNKMLAYSIADNYWFEVKDYPFGLKEHSADGAFVLGNKAYIIESNTKNVWEFKLGINDVSNNSLDSISLNSNRQEKNGTGAASDEKVFVFVEVMPEFPGGELKLMNFLSSNIRYPEMERDNDIQGTVQVKFIVNTDGSVSDIVVVKSVSPALDNEAIRLVKMLPKFSPGKQSGKTVRVYQTIPVVFKLQ